MRMNNNNEGLTSQQVKELTDAGLNNVAVKNQSKTVGQIIYSNLFTYFNLIFAIFSVLLILVRSYINMTFLPIIICNILIGIVQEIRSKKVLDKLTVLSAPQMRVIRDGVEKTVLSEELVKSDLCIFSAGNQICADARVVDGSVRVNESLITGEADEIIKTEGDMLYSGSFVVSGSCKAVLENVGLESYAAKLMIEAKASRKKQQTEMMKSLDTLVRWIGVVIIPIGLCLYLQERFVLHCSVKDSVVAMVAALVGMIPEGLYLLASLALVVSVMRLGKKKVLVHEMSCVETLARVNVLCVDKTGTITENKMAVQQVIPLESYNQGDYEPLHKIIGDVVSNLEADNITMSTLKEYFDEKTDRKAIKVYPFSSETKYSAVQFEHEAYIIGAPEKLLLDKYEEYEADINEFAGMGARVLIFGSYEGSLNGRPLTEPVIPLGMIAISNPVRKEAKNTFKYFEDQGVDIKVISGDNPITVSNIALEAGISGAKQYVDAATLTDDEKIADAVRKYTVFGRVQPEQKKKIVNALKNDGKVVAMTGDGVNDVLALKAADCSVAMASGSDAASNASQIVLLDSDFARMPSVVLEGRRVVNNIQRTASLFIVKNIFSMLLAIVTLVLVNQYPLYPTQLSLLGAFTIGIPAFILALQPNKNIIKGRFITNVLIKALPAGLTDFAVIAFLSIEGKSRGIGIEQLSTMAIIILSAVGIAALIRICYPFDWIRAGVCICMTIGLVISILYLKPIFAIYQLAKWQLILTIKIIVVSMVVFYLMCKLVNLIEVKIQNKRGLRS